MAQPPGLRAIAHELYGLRPDEFTAARTAAEKGARADGDRELAAAVKALRRPAIGAWAVNLLVRRRAELVEQVVELGDQLRQAQSLLQGDALRSLARERRQLVAGIAAEARSLAEEEGQRLGEAAVRQVEETLQAAMTDRSAADAVRSGLLAQPLTSTGLASLAEVLAVPLEEGAPAPQPAPQPAADAPSPERPTLSVVRDADRRAEEAQARVAAAGEAVRAAQKAFDKATKKRSKGEAKVLQLEAELEELRRRVAELEEQTEAAVERLTELDARLEESAATLEDARAEADAAAAASADLS